jgi:hypothetical protein
VFFLGVFVGLVAAFLIGGYVVKNQRMRMASLEEQLSAEFHRVTALENELAAVKAAGVQAVRDEKLRNAREFGQYKTLLRRADVALAQAKAERGDSVLEAA